MHKTSPVPKEDKAARLREYERISAMARKKRN
jgi:hypothetical protein